MPYDRAYFEQNQQIRDRPALRWYARVCRRVLGRRAADVFEFGCGVGWLMHHLAARHCLSGYDVSDFCRAEAARRNPTATIYDDFGQVPRRAFDLVIALHVLEHVPDPAETLRQLADRVRPGGRLLYVVPALGGFGHRVKREQWFAYRDPTHISLLSEEDWRRHTTAAGLRVVQEAGDGLWDPPYVRWLPRRVQWPLFGSAAALQVYVGRGRLFLPARWSECLILIAQRPGSVDGT